VQKVIETFQKIAAVAVVGVFAAVGTVQLAHAQAAQPAQPGQPATPGTEKKVKDQGEYDIFNQTLKDATNPAQQIKDLDTWTQKYPESDYKDDRLYYYIQAYNGAKQPVKVLEIGKGLMDRGLKTVFKDPKMGPQQVLTVLYLMTLNYAQMAPTATPAQQETGEKAAKALRDYVPEYFVAANKQPNVTDADWAKTKSQVDTLAKNVLISIAARPGAEAMAKYRQDKDPANCTAAVDADNKALQEYPENALIVFNLGTAEICLYKTSPDKINPALWHLARAVAIDPTLGGTADAKQIESYLNNAYTQYHGGDDAGLAQLKASAKASLNPPDGFKIKSQIEIAHEKEAEFEKSNPQLAMWMKIKGQLADQNGDQYFEGQLKNADLPPLKGTVIEGKPACRSKELIVGLSDATHAEVTLKLDSALSGKAEPGNEIQFKGVPSAFTKDPFMLTMDAEKAKIDGLKSTPCAAAPARRAPARKKK